MSSDQFAAFKEKCRMHHLKVTPQRVGVYQALMEIDGHPTAEDIFNVIRDEFPNISFDTVYRTLMTFSEIGIIEIVEGQGAPKRFDVNPGDHHHHFYCIGCGRIMDFHSDEMDAVKIPAQIESRFRVLNKRMIVKGYCDQCKGRNHR